MRHFPAQIQVFGERIRDSLVQWAGVDVLVNLFSCVGGDLVLLFSGMMGKQTGFFLMGLKIAFDQRRYTDHIWGYEDL